MVVEALDGTIVFLDTTPLIYFIEGHSSYHGMLKRLFASNDKGNFTFISSCVTLLEVLVQPLRLGRGDLVNQYQKILLQAKGINIFEINNEIAVRAATLRAGYNIKTPDALQIATALEFNANYFLTNDLRLKGVAGIQFITLADLT